jgi:hypothetical protein
MVSTKQSRTERDGLGNLGDCVRVRCKLQLSKHVSSLYLGCESINQRFRRTPGMRHTENLGSPSRICICSFGTSPFFQRAVRNLTR